MPFRLRLFHRLLKFVSRKNLEQLVHDAAKSFHGAVPPADLSVRRTKIYHRISASFQTRFPPSQNLIWTDVPHEEGIISSAPSDLPPIISSAPSDLPPIISSAPSDLPPIISSAPSDLPPIISS